jgi:glutamate 5-kinase
MAEPEQTVSLVRQEVFHSCQTVIVKIGSNVLTTADDRLDEQRVRTLSAQIDAVQSTGRHVVLVSSGAVAAGIGILGLKQRPESLPELQAAASIGQPRLMQAWNAALSQFGHRTAQVLVTVNDFRNRQRYLNVRNTLRTLLDYDVIPVINENDTVSIKEIAVGDNDQLASMLATLLPRPLLVILSGVDGLFDGPPSDAGSRVLSLVEHPDHALLPLAAAEQSRHGRGGMTSKLKAIISATAMGEAVILANGRGDAVLQQIIDGREIGTLFLATGETVPAWKRWIGFTTAPAGMLTLDDGAVRAVRESGTSLLAVGITSLTGDFESGGVVGLQSTAGVEFARGLVNYSSRELAAIIGKRKEQIAETLGHASFAEVIHRDNLALTGR